MLTRVKRYTALIVERRSTADLFFDHILRRSLFEPRGRDRRAVSLVDVEELASYEGQARDLVDRTGMNEPFEAAAAVGMRPR